MKKFFSIVAALFVTVTAFGQSNILRQRLEVAEVEVNDGEVNLEVFQMQDNGQYYLSVGTMGIGDDIIQIHFDPLTELFIPLGGTLEEAINKLDQIRDYYKQGAGKSWEVEGCLSIGNPTDNLETIKITGRQLLFSKLLEFSVQRDDLIRATHIARSDFNSLVSSVKFYQKLHPNEK